MRNDKQMPQARRDDLVVQQQGEETLVYDTKNHHAHCLNRLAATVWNHCDGRRTSAELATLVHKQLGTPNDAAVVEVALAELGQAKLLDSYTPTSGSSLSRRELGRKLGIAMLMTPLITSIRTQPAMAAASLPPGSGGRGGHHPTTASHPTTVHGTTGTTVHPVSTTPGTTTPGSTTRGPTTGPILTTTVTTAAPTTGKPPPPTTTRQLVSDRNLKQDFSPVAVKEVLRCLTGIPMETWSYREQPETRHIGPMAQDFAAAFGVGDDNRHIDTVDAAGVAFSAIQALHWMLEEKNQEIRELRADVDSLQARLDSAAAACI